MKLEGISNGRILCLFGVASACTCTLGWPVFRGKVVKPFFFLHRKCFRRRESFHFQVFVFFSFIRNEPECDVLHLHDIKSDRFFLRVTVQMYFLSVWKISKKKNFWPMLKKIQRKAVDIATRRYTSKQRRNSVKSVNNEANEQKNSTTDPSTASLSGSSNSEFCQLVNSTTK